MTENANHTVLFPNITVIKGGVTELEFPKTLFTFKYKFKAHFKLKLCSDSLLFGLCIPWYTCMVYMEIKN